MVRTFPRGKKLELIEGDITKVPADAIVNAANAALRGGGGVDGAIHRAGGPAIMEELKKIREEKGGCPTGSAVVTTAGNLPAKYVFHAVGPIYKDGKHGEPELLRSAYKTCLELAEQYNVRRITFPALSTGAYGYPMEPAAEIALTTAIEHLQNPNSKVQEVIFVLYGKEAYGTFARVLERLMPEKAEASR